jgi:hypothetical protein
MAQETSRREKDNCTLLQGPDGRLYCLSETNLAEHRIPHDVAVAVRQAYERDGATTPTPDAGQFQILGRGPVVRRTGLTVPTLDSWFDIYA